jgi:hypothetical protein
MIVLNLSCSNSHRFEGWFASNEAFDVQAERQIISCPICGNDEIARLPSAPRVKRAPAVPASVSAAPVAGEQYALFKAAASVVQQIIKASEDVGERFADEARAIHRNEAPARNIRGVASREEAKDLIDEGILVVPLPLPPKGDLH